GRSWDPFLREYGGAVHGGADALIGDAAAEVAREGGVNIGIAGISVGGEQRGSRHDLSRLAVAALDDVHLGLATLHRVAAVPRQPLDGRDRFAYRGRDGHDAGPSGRAVDVYRAGAA